MCHTLDSDADQGPGAGKANPHPDCVSIPIKMSHWKESIVANLLVS